MPLLLFSNLKKLKFYFIFLLVILEQMGFVVLTQKKRSVYVVLNEETQQNRSNYHRKIDENGTDNDQTLTTFQK